MVEQARYLPALTGRFTVRIRFNCRRKTLYGELGCLTRPVGVRKAAKVLLKISDDIAYDISYKRRS